MIGRSLVVLMGVLITSLARADTPPSEPQPKPTFTEVAPGAWKLDWNGVAGRTYFIQTSTNLEDWYYQPVMAYGDGLWTIPGLGSNSPKYFVRLHYTDIPTNDAELADFDLDGLGNLEELNLGTDPMNADSDADGIPDGVEIADGGDPLSNTDGDTFRSYDSDGDGLSDAVELVKGTSPTLWDSDGDGFSDAQDAYPLNPARHDNSPLTTGDTTQPTIVLEEPANAILVSGP